MNRRSMAFKTERTSTAFTSRRLNSREQSIPNKFSDRPDLGEPGSRSILGPRSWAPPRVILDQGHAEDDCAGTRKGAARPVHQTADHCERHKISSPSANGLLLKQRLTSRQRAFSVFFRVFKAIAEGRRSGTAFAFLQLLRSMAIEASSGAAYACRRHRRRKVFASVRVSSRSRSAISERRFFMPVSAGQIEPT